MTNDDVLGDAIPYDQQEAMRQFCYHSLKLGAGVGAIGQIFYLLAHSHVFLEYSILFVFRCTYGCFYAMVALTHFCSITLFHGIIRLFIV